MPGVGLTVKKIPTSAALAEVCTLVSGILVDIEISCNCFLFAAVVLPETVDDEVAASCIGDAVRAYIALQYLGRVSFGDTVLIMDAATSFGSLAVQLAHAWGAKVGII